MEVCSPTLIHPNLHSFNMCRPSSSNNRKLIAESAMKRIHKMKAVRPVRAAHVSPFLSFQEPIARKAILVNASSVLFGPAKKYYKSAPLLLRTLKEETHAAYDRTLATFAASLGENHVSLQNLDLVLSQYAMNMFNNPASGNRQMVVNTLCALSHRLPNLKSELPVTRAALKGWKAEISCRQAAPITRSLRDLVVMHLFEQGEIEIAACISVAWAALLRIGEAIRLQRKDISLPGDPRLADVRTGCYGILVRDAKTGPAQIVIIRDPLALCLIKKCLHRSALQKQTCLYRVSYMQVAQKLRTALAKNGIDPTAFTTHSLRHGGALHSYLRGQSAEQIAIQGRWAATKSLQRYLTSGRSKLMQINISASARQAIEEAEQKVMEMVQAEIAHNE